MDPPRSVRSDLDARPSDLRDPHPCPHAPPRSPTPSPARSPTLTNPPSHQLLVRIRQGRLVRHQVLVDEAGGDGAADLHTARLRGWRRRRAGGPARRRPAGAPRPRRGAWRRSW